MTDGTPFGPTKLSLRDSVRFKRFSFGNLLNHPHKKTRFISLPPPASILPTLRVAEATHLGGPPSPQIPEVRRSPRGGTPTPCAV